MRGQTGAGNDWAKGCYTEGAESIDSELDVCMMQLNYRAFTFDPFVNIQNVEA